jgi:hypothetical protein
MKGKSSAEHRAKTGLFFWAKVAWMAFLIAFMKPPHRKQDVLTRP